MSTVDTLMPANYDQDDRNHGDIMDEFLTASASDEQYLSGAHSNGNYRTQQRLQPYIASQVPRGDLAGSYQDTQIAQPTSIPPGSSLSPSISSYHDRATPDAYSSDQSYIEYSQYTTPSFIEDPLLDIGNVLNLDGAGDLSSFDNAAFSSQEPYATNDNPSAPSNDLQAPIFTRNGSVSHLLSPCTTSRSSPVSSSEGTQNPSQCGFPSTTDSGTTRQHSATQQHSPALTGSPGGVFITGAQTIPSNPSNPVVRIENYESPLRKEHTRNLSQRSRSRRSGMHLSPFDAEGTSEDGSEDSTQQPNSAGQVNIGTDDGSWIPTHSTRVGISPEDRGRLNQDKLPTLDEQQNQRLADEKKLEVQEWLVKSESNFPEPSRLRTRGRRAVSTSDMSRGLGVHMPHYDDSNIPGPGVFVDVESEGDYEEESEDDAYEGPDTPPADASIAVPPEDDSYFPSVTQGDMDGQPDVQSEIPPRVWCDPPQQPVTDDRYQPQSSNAAIMRFKQRAKDIETASMAATIGSRRRSESELGSIFHVSGVSKPITNLGDKAKDKRERRPSFLENILPKRNSTSSKRALPSDAVKSAHNPRRSGSWGRPKSPKVDTSSTGFSNDGLSPSTSHAPAGPSPLANVRNAIRRSRSRSDIGIGKSPGLGELMMKHGGPPMVKLATPANDEDGASVSRDQEGSGDDEDADDDDVAQGFVTMDLSVRSDPIIPTLSGFRSHAKQLNPRLDEYMVERVAQEQNRRYKRLLESKVKHLKAVEKGDCSSRRCCTALGGTTRRLKPKAATKDPEVPFVGFHVGPLSDDEFGATDGMIAAQFPAGVPNPPVKSLPAEFECPLCFKIKKFYKPSDWTKHVHEDIQPFTCTFPNCGEPKSFKRKADWVRHENERHRQLEFWTCRIGECNHTCYRKDNFVQHLVREHKIPEPRPKVGKPPSGNDALISSVSLQNWNSLTDDLGDPSEQIWVLVEQCRHDTTKQPRQEPCRFCGNKCNSWKKLTVHLAKHMEQISLPVLSLVEQKNLNPDTIISPVEQVQPSRSRATSAASAGRAPQVAISSPSRYDQNPVLNNNTFNNGSSFPPLSSDVGAPGTASGVMHTYPPPQVFAYRPPAQMQPQPQKRTQANAFQSDTTGASYAMSSYAGLPAGNNMQVPARPIRNGYGPSRGNMQYVQGYHQMPPASYGGAQQSYSYPGQ
ncbi:hypothetical protein K490DRAFT_73107 [Saccharata proteae CBS 121410]|uniref:C2H2-type domain-containing protein n=1 Tax=Saccharata proteae CBS 121410 TaxID=1314787 RepID=A0A9P4HYY6_9PEZI|nr:hypothetical protein K490DRAFT_73107 [Saccharata proteae CBS 121410]